MVSASASAMVASGVGAHDSVGGLTDILYRRGHKKLVHIRHGHDNSPLAAPTLSQAQAGYALRRPSLGGSLVDLTTLYPHGAKCAASVVLL